MSCFFACQLKVTFDTDTSALNQGEMHFRHPVTATHLCAAAGKRMRSRETGIYPLVRRTYGKIDHCWFERKSIYHIWPDFSFPSLSFWFYHKAGHFFGSDVAKGRILWYTSSNISVNRECASFSIRAIEFYWNEYRMDGIVYSRCPFNRQFAKTLNGYLNLFSFYLWCHFWQLFFCNISISNLFKATFKYCFVLSL